MLTEATNRNQIIDAVKTKNVVTIYYAGDHIVNKGYRDVEIFCYGYSRWGHDSIRAWQTDGVTDTPDGKPMDPLTKIPGWRFFRVDRIKSIQPTDEYFTIIRPKFNAEDKDMATIYISASFEPNDQEVSNSEENPEVIPDNDFNSETPDNNTSSETPKKSSGFWNKIFGKKDNPNTNNSNTIKNNITKPSSNEPVKRDFLKRIGDKFKTFLDKK